MRRACVIVLMGLVVTVAPSTPVGAIEQEWVLETPYQAEATAIDPAGNVYVAGDTSREATLEKLAPDGSVLWRRSWGPDPDAWVWSTAVTLGDDGSVSWAGGASIPCMAGLDRGGWFIRTLTPGGRLLWQRAYASWKHPCRGPGASVSDLSAGPHLVAATMNHYLVDVSPPTEDGFVVAFGPQGAVRWRAPIERSGTASGPADGVSGVATGRLNNVYVTGWVSTGSGAGIAAVLQKVSAQGRVLWATRLPVEACCDMDVAARGDAVMVAGPEGSGDPSSGWLGRFTPGGSLVWSHTWGEGRKVGAEPAQVALDPATGAWVVGTQRDASDRGYDMFIRRYAPTGRLLWVRVLYGPGRNMFGTGIAVTADAVVATGAVDPWNRSKGRVFRYSK